MTGRTNATGGGLNFHIYSTEPTNPATNDIWLNTTTGITGYEFSVEEPEASEGKVWFLTGEPYTASFNAIKNNCIQVNLMAAYQCVAGKWVSIDGYIYQGGWVQFSAKWDGYYYKNGNQYEAITGGWVAEQWGNYGTASNDPKLSVTSAYAASAIGTVKPVDLTDVSKICFTSPSGKMNCAYGGYLRVCTSKNPSDAVVSVYISEKGSGSLDVSSLSGYYYLCLYAIAGSSGYGACDVSEIWAE